MFFSVCRAFAVIASGLMPLVPALARERIDHNYCRTVAISVKLNASEAEPRRIDALSAERYFYSWSQQYQNVLEPKFGIDYVEKMRSGLIKALLLSGRYVEAENVAAAALETALLRFGNASELAVAARSFLAEALYYQGRYYEARIVLSSLEKLDISGLPNNSFALSVLPLARARLSAITGERRQAIEQFRSADSLDYSDFAFLVDLMADDTKPKDMAAFLENAERSLFPSMGDGLAKWCTVIAINLARHGQADRAQGLLEAGTAYFHHPDDANHWLMIDANASLAGLYRQQGRYGSAYQRIQAATRGIWANAGNDAVNADIEDARHYLVNRHAVFLQMIGTGWAVTHPDPISGSAGRRKKRR